MPKTTIEPEEVAAPIVRDEPEAQVEVAEEEAPREAGHALQKARGWVSRTFPGHENAFYGGAAGLMVALLVFAIGIGRTLFIGLLVLVGVAVGQAIDGDPKIIRSIRGFIESQNNR